MTTAISKHTRTLLTASFFRGVGKATLWGIASDPLFYRVEPEQLGDVHPALSDFDLKSERYFRADLRAAAEIEKADSLGVRIIGFADPEYPNSFRRAPSAPAFFWYRGATQALTIPNVAVIGTRQPTPSGSVIANRIAAALSENGFCVASGLALGIDATAHEASVSLGKPTIAILAGGLDSINPKRNERLAERIVDMGGGLLSEFPIGVPSLPTNFVVRDSTQAAIAAAVVLVQSDKVGGSLHASRACVKLRRKLYVVKPIEQDILRGEKKIQGNIALIGGEIESMNFPDASDKYIIPLSGREDYASFFESARNTWSSFGPRH